MMGNLEPEQGQYVGWQKAFSRRYLHMTCYCANISDHHTLKQTEAVLISVMPNAVWKIMYQKNGKQMNRWYLVMLSRP